MTPSIVYIGMFVFSVSVILPVPSLTYVKSDIAITPNILKEKIKLISPVRLIIYIDDMFFLI